jgi:septal ring factor EnvC (AmiA/AmiB activator)
MTAVITVLFLLLQKEKEQLEKLSAKLTQDLTCEQQMRHELEDLVAIQMTTLSELKEKLDHSLNRESELSAQSDECCLQVQGLSTQFLECQEALTLTLESSEKQLAEVSKGFGMEKRVEFGPRHFY